MKKIIFAVILLFASASSADVGVSFYGAGRGSVSAGGTPPSYVAESALTVASGSTITIPPYAGLQDNDIIYLLVISEYDQSDEEPVGPQWPSGFVQVTYAENSPNTCSYLAWKRASSESGNYVVTITDHASACSGLSFGVSGAVASGTPTEQSSALYSTGTTGTFTAITPTIDYSLIILLTTSGESYGGTSNASGWTGGGLSWNEEFEDDDGQYNYAALATADQSTAAEITSPSVTFSTAPVQGQVGILISVRP